MGQVCQAHTSEQRQLIGELTRERCLYEFYRRPCCQATTHTQYRVMHCKSLLNYQRTRSFAALRMTTLSTIVILSAAKDLLPRLLLDSIGHCAPILPQCGRTFRSVILPAAPQG